MWAGITGKLRIVEDNVLRRGIYVDKFDAMSLASVETTSRSEEVNALHSFTPVTQLKGLTNLVADLSTMLHEAYIKQQTEIMNLQLGIKRYQSGLHSNDIYENDNHGNSRDDGLNNSFSQLSEMGSTCFDASISPNSVPSSSSSESAMRQFRMSIQDFHNRLIDIIDTKLLAREVVVSSIETYRSYMVKIAKENGVLDPYQRASFLIEPQLQALIAHKFFETAEVKRFYEIVLRIISNSDRIILQINISLASVRTLLATSFYSGDVALAERKLLLNVRH